MNSPPSVEALLEDLRGNASHTTAEWLALRRNLLLRALVAEHAPEIAAPLPEPTVFGESTRRGRLPLLQPSDPTTYCDCPSCEGHPTHKESP